ncbi:MULTISPECIES: MarR family winged helix-turn-helix transcriptional regulator [unclassified Crossiella]|uniref:MarR family winged helix-turn-helix transcriptional regulator n=1 Tax=unclassified Crossiella TaxID=2620835 RepID=UPI0020000862|nr:MULTISPECIES: MarR family transcriptional regulator [unclassified Crossiella]MCK2239721.1 MarR family transcriptional regulator [Crossiella sp. S99.2]MCK2252416.1 MarR family transcriptional regulator [Crossiella sp. S99.1]
MDYSDAELARQPVGYWTGLAHETVIRHIHQTHGTLGVTQRHWMTLNALVRHEGGLTRAEVTDYLRQYLTPQIGEVATYPAVLDDLLDKGWIAVGAGGRLTLTEAGVDGRARLADLTAGIRGRLHDGVSEADYATAVRVLRRIIGNAGGPVTLP